MATQLREVLNRFVDQTEPLSVTQMAREMQLELGVLHGMIAYWVQKGKLREVSSAKTCGSCGVKGHCPFVVDLPRYYELVGDDESGSEPSCTCGHCTSRQSR